MNQCLKWAVNNRNAFSRTLAEGPQQQELLEAVVVNDVTLELTVKTAKQGNVHRMM